MKALLLGGSLLVALPGVAQQLLQTPPVARPPESAYADLVSRSKEVAHLLRRALAEPNDSKAIALLNGQETARLMEQAQAMRPALSRWATSLSPTQQEEFFQRFRHESPLMQCLNSLDSNQQAKARFERNPSLKSALDSLVYYTM